MHTQTVTVLISQLLSRPNSCFLSITSEEGFLCVDFSHSVDGMHKIQNTDRKQLPRHDVAYATHLLVASNPINN